LTDLTGQLSHVGDIQIEIRDLTLVGTRTRRSPAEAAVRAILYPDHAPA
jgi:hypothetical protein